MTSTLSPLSPNAGNTAFDDAPTIILRKKTRLRGIDAARGVALLGMIAVHSLLLVDDDGNATLAFTVAAGRAAALFAVLAGVGIALLTGRRRVEGRRMKPVAASLLTRATIIGTLGLLLGYADVDFAVVILPYYAILFLIAVPLVMLPTAALVAIGVAAATVVPAILTLAGESLPEPIIDNPGLVDLVTSPVSWLLELTLLGEFPVLPWVAYLCAGLIIGRLKLKNLDVAATMLLVGSVLTVGAYYVSRALLYTFGGFERILEATHYPEDELREIMAFGHDGLVPADTLWWLAVDAPHTSTTTDIAGTIGSSLVVLAAFLLIDHIPSTRIRRVAGVLTFPLATAGAMTLTLYVAHIWFINSSYDNYSPGVGYAVQVIAAILIGLAVKFTAGRGPLEALTTAAANRMKSVVTPPVRMP